MVNELTMFGGAKVNRESKPSNSVRAMGPMSRKKCCLSDSATISPQVHSQDAGKEEKFTDM